MTAATTISTSLPIDEHRILPIIACRRTRLLRKGGNPDPLAGTGLDRFLAATLQHARTAGELRLDQDARSLWTCLGSTESR